MLRMRLFIPLRSLAVTALTSAFLLICCTEKPCPTVTDTALFDSLYAHERDTLRLQQVRDSLKAIGAKGEAALVHVDKQLGRLMRHNSLFLRALEYHREGLHLAEKRLDTVEIVRALNNIATNHRRMGFLYDAASAHFTALKLCDHYSDTASFTARKNRVVAINGLGNVYLSLGDLELADTLFRLALKTERDLGSHLGQAINWCNLGSIWSQRGQLDSAWACYRRSMHENELEGSALGIGLCHLYYGSLLEKQHQLDDAIAEYRQAYDLLSSGTDQWHWLQVAVALGNVHLKKVNHPEAARYLDTAWQVATTIHSLEHQSEIAGLRYHLYDLEGDPSKALDYLRESARLHDSVANAEKVLRTQNERLRYLDQRRHMEMEHVQDELKTERRIVRVTRLAFSLALVLALTLVALLIFYIRLRARRQRALVARYERQLLHTRQLQQGQQAEAPTETAETPTTHTPSLEELAPVDEVLSAPEAASASPSEQIEFLTHFNQLLLEHLAEPQLGAAFLADKLCISSRQLSRKVKECTGLDTMTCIRTIRVNTAKKLLAESSEPVLDIAIRCGFDSQSYFARVFKQVTGLTPSEFRRQNPRK